MSESTRTLTITARRVPWIATPWVSPQVEIDGVRYPLGWQTRTYAIAADRPVKVECLMPFASTYGRAIANLNPTDAAELEYSAPSSRFFAGEIGAPGTTHTQGKALTYALFAVIALIVVYWVVRWFS